MNNLELYRCLVAIVEAAACATWGNGFQWNDETMVGGEIFVSPGFVLGVRG